jgi:hypothetical protein
MTCLSIFRYQQLTDTAIHEPENKNNYFTDCTYGNLSGLIWLSLSLEILLQEAIKSFN